MRIELKEWYQSGQPWVWLNAGAVAVSMVMVVGLLALIAVRGLGHFWPHAIIEAELQVRDAASVRIFGKIADYEDVPAGQLRASGVDVPDGVQEMRRYLVKVGNRDLLGSDFRWVLARDLHNETYPPEIMAVERREWGNLYGYLREVHEEGRVVATGAEAWPELLRRIDRVMDLHTGIHAIEKKEIGAINHRMERLRLRERGLQLRGEDSPEALAEIAAARKELDAAYEVLQENLTDLYRQINRDSFVSEAQDGRLMTVSLAHVVRAFKPNDMGLFAKIGHYIAKLWEFVSDEPREANTEGGIYPAIFGTVLMVLLMSVMVTPFGVVAAVYLREYARQGFVTRTIRIAVNNLAGVPSIVYGVFGLGFFIYLLGGSIDALFFPEALPAPTFGTGGLMWASLTLALLTLPVVIVSTEEGLTRIPKAVREGSLALGATKAETLWKVILPMSSPAIMTGVILAVARAAGEVAPLMLVGVVKLAPTLPLNGNYPFLHLDQKFMHLGFHIYDVGFQSPNVEAARPLVYATALLLVVVIAVLNLSAVQIRNHLREKYKALEN